MFCDRFERAGQLRNDEHTKDRVTAVLYIYCSRPLDRRYYS